MSTDDGLESAARQALALTAGRIAVFGFGSRKLVAKRLSERPRGRVQTLLTAWLAHRVMGRRPPAGALNLSSATISMDYEATRLEQLAAAGVRVPEIFLRSTDTLVMAHCGTVVAELLEGWDAATWRPILARLAQELGEFHAAGHWHGGAQIKNLVMQDDRVTRIDFEEHFGDVVPLPVAQACDLILFINSISLAARVDEAESRRLLPVLLHHYHAAHPSGEVNRVLRKIVPALRALTRTASVFRRLSRKGIRRASILADVLAAHLDAR